MDRLGSLAWALVAVLWYEQRAAMAVASGLMPHAYSAWYRVVHVAAESKE